MLGFFFTVLILTGIWAYILSSSNMQDIKDHWSERRCEMNVLPFASLYGHDTSENFSYCMKNIFTMESGPLLSPVFQILATLIGTVSVFITTLNSIRVQFATLLGGINTIFQNFADRMKQLTYHIRVSAMRINFLMKRLFGTLNAMTYMTVSGITAMSNFGDTFLFKFLDTFCFDPDTPISVKGKGLIPISQVEMNDELENDSRVTSVFQFYADGQPMVTINQVLVSTNHYVQDGNKWVRAEEHSDAKPAAAWSGGLERPLICLNTSNHMIQIGGYIFMDYDETEDGDDMTMELIENIVNGINVENRKKVSYSNTIDKTTMIKMKDGSVKSAESIKLGEKTLTGKVIGILKKETSDICITNTGEKIGAGLLIWNNNQWVRAGTVYPVSYVNTPLIFVSLILTPSAILETEAGLSFRDYMEVHSPDSEDVYEKHIRATVIKDRSVSVADATQNKS